MGKWVTFLTMVRPAGLSHVVARGVGRVDEHLAVRGAAQRGTQLLQLPGQTWPETGEECRSETFFWSRAGPKHFIRLNKHHFLSIRISY